jgi:AcrR family transcriptional regulator
VREAIVDAAYRLFQMRSPQQVSLREIAAEARVQYSLVHRHFGTKEAVLAAVIEKVADRGAAIVRDAPDPVSAMRALRASHSGPGFSRMLAWAILDGADLERIVQKSHTMATVVELMRSSATAGPGPGGGGEPAFDAEMAYAAGVLLLIGWSFFEPYLVQLTGLRDVDPSTIQAQLSDMTDLLMRHAAATGTTDG